MDKYAFDPKRLLLQITTIVLRVWKQDHPRVSNDGGSPLSTPSPASGGTTMGKVSFTVSLSNHPDYSQTTMTKCASVLQKQMLGDPALLADFTDFIKQVKIRFNNIIKGLLREGEGKRKREQGKERGGKREEERNREKEREREREIPLESIYINYMYQTSH